MSKTRVAILVILICVMVLVLIVLALLPQGVSAQTATPTPTPDVGYYMEMTSGEHFRIEREVTFGDIAVVISTAITSLALFALLLFEVVTRYLI